VARTTPTRNQPTGLSAVSQNVKPIPRADQSPIGGARGSLYPNDPMGNRVSPDRVPATLDRVGPRSRTSPLGQPRSSDR
jgi:hypothetical protein